MLTSANGISSGLYRLKTGITSYFSLRDINYDLQRNNAELEMQLLRMNAILTKAGEYIPDSVMNGLNNNPMVDRYKYQIANVINNSTNKAHNYITIDKGEADSIKPEMGVIDQNGVVGIVNVVGKHSARVLSLLNNNLRISCKIKDSEHVGSLVWDGHTPQTAILEELPRHATFTKGDTIVTSGHSTAFPKGVPVGIILGQAKGYDENSFTIRIKLFTDFTTLSSVRIISDLMKPELDELESHDDNADNSSL